MMEETELDELLEDKLNELLRVELEELLELWPGEELDARLDELLVIRVEEEDDVESVELDEAMFEDVRESEELVGLPEELEIEGEADVDPIVLEDDRPELVDDWKLLDDEAEELNDSQDKELPGEDGLELDEDCAVKLLVRELEEVTRLEDKTLLRDKDDDWLDVEELDSWLEEAASELVTVAEEITLLLEDTTGGGGRAMHRDPNG